MSPSFLLSLAFGEYHYGKRGLIHHNTQTTNASESKLIQLDKLYINLIHLPQDSEVDGSFILKGGNFINE